MEVKVLKPVNLFLLVKVKRPLEHYPRTSKGMAKLANNVAQFDHYVGQQIQVKKCSWHVCTCSKHFHEHLLLDRMLSNLATMFANNSTDLGKSCGRNMRKSFKSIVTSTSLVAKWILN